MRKTMKLNFELIFDQIRININNNLNKILFLLFTILLGLSTTISIQAATFTVNNNGTAADLTPGDGICQTAGGNCTLRAAVQEANALAGNDIINFNPSVTSITVSSELPINNFGTLTINGNGADVLTVSGSTSRVFLINNSATAIINDLAITNGNGAGTLGTFGGAILVNVGNLTLNRVFINNNSTANGAGVFAFRSTLNINNSTISGNTATNTGGGVSGFSNVLAPSIINITNSTISNNTANQDAGGIYSENATYNLTHVTVADNTAGNDPMANQGGGVYNLSGTFNSRNSIFANNSAGSGPDFFGTVTSQNFNLIENTTDSTGFTGTNDITGQDPLLSPLQNNSGTTPTRALLPGSPAIDTGNSFGFNVDQRGSTRPVNSPIAPNGAGDLADIGAFEVQAPTAASVEVSGRVMNFKGRGIARAVIYLSDQQGNMRTTITNPFGYYRFNELMAGETYTFMVLSKQYQFIPQTVNLDDNLQNLNFFGF